MDGRPSIEVPYATPEDLLSNRGGNGNGENVHVGGRIHAGGMNELMRFMDCGPLSDMGVLDHHRGVGGAGGGGEMAGLEFNAAGVNDAAHAPLHSFLEQQSMDIAGLAGLDYLEGGHVGGLGISPGPGSIIPHEDMGFDMFIRPGSLIFGAHAQGAVVSPSSDTEAPFLSTGTGTGTGTGAGAGATNEPGERRGAKRHTAASLLESCANGDSIESRLVRCATAALHSGFSSNSSYWSSGVPSTGAKGSGSGGAGGRGRGRGRGRGESQGSHMVPFSYDATGVGLFTIPEGVFGSFNGEISRLEIGPDGKPLTVGVHGLPKGFSVGTLDVASSIVDSSAKTATLHLPWTPEAGTTIVCMFRGAHLPLRVHSVGGSATELEISFAPQGGDEVPAAWALTGGGSSDIKAANDSKQEEREQDQEDASDYAGSEYGSVRGREERERRRTTHDYLEGTATLEVLIADGPMKGLPVGVTLPILLTPDSKLRDEVLKALLPLQRTSPHGAMMVMDTKTRVSTAGKVSDDDSAAQEGEDIEEFDETAVMPPPVALMSMLGAVLSSRARGQNANPRQWRGVLAMTRYFELKHTAERLGVDFVPRYPVATTTAFNAVTNAIAVLWSLRTIGLMILLACFVLKHFYPFINWEGAASYQTLINLAPGVVPLAILSSTRRFEQKNQNNQPRDMQQLQLGCGLVRWKPWTLSHAGHAVTAQNCGATLGPFFSFAVIVSHLKQLLMYKRVSSLSTSGGGGITTNLEPPLDETLMSTGYLVRLLTVEIIPSAILVFTLKFLLSSTRARERWWPEVSLGVHVGRAAACLTRTHLNYYGRRKLFKGMALNIISALTGVLLFPLRSTTKTLVVHAALVVCDWVGHYLSTGTSPAYSLPMPGLTAHEREQSVVTMADAWMAAAMDLVWRVLTPAAVNALIMCRSRWPPYH